MNYNIELTQSSSFRWRIELYDEVTGEPKDLTGAEVFFNVRNSKGELLANFSPYTNINSVETYVIDVDAPSDASDNLSGVFSRYDIAVRCDNGDIYRPLSGSVMVRSSVSEVSL